MLATPSAEKPSSAAQTLSLASRADGSTGEWTAFIRRVATGASGMTRPSGGGFVTQCDSCEGMVVQAALVPAFLGGST
jgi:hypothetical protein